MGRLLTIVRKEFIHIRRDPRTLAVMFLIPVVQLVLLGYAATTEVEHIPTAVLDWDKSPQSRELIEAYRASGYFDIEYYVGTEEELARLIDKGEARAGLIIPAGYGEELLGRGSAQVAFIIDGSDPNIAKTAFSAAQSVGQAKSARMMQKLVGKGPQKGIEVRPKVWYNPELKSANFMIPGLIGIILQVLTTVLTAIAIVREREQGTIEQLIVTPIRPLELVVGKLIPYIFIALWDTAEVLAIGSLWFKVPIRGSIPLLFALSGIALMTSLGLGLLISTVSKTQQEAMLLTYFTMLPSIFLSGFIFPIAAMPKFLQYVSYIIPLTYLLVIIRGIILKGVGLEILAEQVIALAMFGAVTLTLAATRFRKRLE
jgi:ABC-2 type transport system permease protein